MILITFDRYKLVKYQIVFFQLIERFTEIIPVEGSISAEC